MKKNMKVFRYAFDIAKKDVLIELGMLLNRCLNAPYTMTFVLTDRCDARCITCEQWKNKGDPKELSLGEWKQLLLDLHGWAGTFGLMFTGGEPFLKKDFFELLEYASKFGLYTNVCTNGIIFEKSNYDRIISSGVDRVTFSLNSIEPELHNQMKGVEGLHQKIVSAVRYIKKDSDVCIAVMFVITRDNYRMMDGFSRWAYDIGVDCIDFQPIRDTFGKNLRVSPTINASFNNPLWRIDDLDELDRQVDMVISRKKSGYPITTPHSDLEALKTYFRNPDKVRGRRQCTVGSRNLIVLSNGDVKLCYYFPPVGNVRENGIKDIWFSKKAQEQRAEMLKCEIPCVAACLREFNLSEKFLNFLIRLGIRGPKSGI